MAYPFTDIEQKWQRFWDEHQTFRTPGPGDEGFDPDRPKYYVLDMFPYPSGSGLHVGHPEGYTATDIVARYKRMQGVHVLHPMGWDAFGLPAEQYALKTNTHPRETTKTNIAQFKRQLKRLGFSYDWQREINTTDPDYYKWTQWIFLQLYKKGLAYQAEVPVNWCPAQGTVLANEEVKDGKYVETGDPVEQRSMRQWMLKITAFADRLLDDLEECDWPEGIKAMQRHWIGRSEGAEITFEIEGKEAGFTVFTTRPDTLYGATYAVLAPEHALVDQIMTAEQRPAVNAYRAEAAEKAEEERTGEAGGKTGVFTGAYAINPVNGERLPVWIADYVLAGYGTGAIMAVPAHDERDHEFARTFDLPIREVIQSPSGHDIAESAWTGEGEAVNSGMLDGLGVSDAKSKIIAWLEENGHGTGKTQYRLRDWLFSRQRYWGEPFPIVHTEDGRIVPLPEDALPLTPPELDDYKPTPDGRPPLERAESWVATTDPQTGEPAMRETNTMPQWAGSCWYYLRFIDPDNDEMLVDPEKEKYWMPVDLYVGGAEHAVLHLLYARFWHKVLYDIGVVSTKEPFQRLFNQGMILAYSYRDAAGKYYSPELVTERDGGFYIGETELSRKIDKMSKSRYNVVNPDDVVEEYGADSLRLYEMFMGPLDVTKPWQTSGVGGMKRFLSRVWRVVLDDADRFDESVVGNFEPDEDLLRLRHKTVRAVGEDIEALRFNTAIARLMELTNALTGAQQRPREIVETLILLLAPFAPHIAEELWSKMGHGESLAYAPWPQFDEALAKDDLTEYVVQINGKVRHKITGEANLGRDELLALAKAEPRVQELLSAGQVVKEIAVPGKLVNFVVK